MLTRTQEALALGLLSVGAIKFGQFRLKLHETNPTAPLSPFYIDLRIVRSAPDVFESAIEAYREAVSGVSFDVLADVPTAATPFVAVLAYLLRRPMVSPRASAKAHGTQRRVDGVATPGAVALLIDDVVTTADSKIEAIRTLEASRIQVRQVVVLVDREQGGTAALRHSGCECTAVFSVRTLFDHYVERGLIEPVVYSEALRYLAGSGGGL